MYKSIQKGFTLIELLIVIALLGALVIGLLTALDPIEQINRGRDTAVRNTASEFFNASNRYYANIKAFPWGTGVYSTAANGTTFGASVTNMINAGELKTNFWSRATADLNKILVTSLSDTDLKVCFMPVSKAQKVDPAAIYDNQGGNGTACGTGTSTCYVCFR